MSSPQPGWAVYPANPHFTYERGSSKCQTASVVAFGDHSPRAALTGTFDPTAAITPPTTSASAIPSGPREGSFTSTKSAPAFVAATASSTDRTLTNSPHPFPFAFVFMTG